MSLTSSFRIFLLALATVATASIQAQSTGDAWDSSFKLVVGDVSGATTSTTAKPLNYGISIEGAYPLPGGNQYFAIEGGWRWFSNRSVTAGSIPAVPPATGAPASYSSWATTYGDNGYLISAFYRRKALTPGFFWQAGVRYMGMTTTQKDKLTTVTTDPAGVVLTNASVSNTITQTTDHFGLIGGAGFRFDKVLSLEFNVSTISLATPTGASNSGLMFELALGIHN